MLTSRVVSAATALLLVLPVFAQRFVYPTADPARFTVQKDIPYSDGLTFDLYRPAGESVVPVMIFANVGISGMKNWPGYVGWGEAVAAAGMAAVHYDAVDGKHFENFAAVVGALRERAGALKIDPERIVIWGGSTNVRLALPLAMNRSNSFIKGAVIYYGTGDVTEFRTDLPVFFVRAGLERGDFAKRIDATLMQALAANAPWTIESYGGGLHGFDLYNDNDVSREIIRRTLDFALRVTDPRLTRAYALSAVDASLGAAFNRGEWAAAIAGYQQKVTKNPGDAESHRRLGHAFYETGRYEESLEAFEAAFRAGSRGPRDVMVPAVRAAARAHREERALYWLDRALSVRFIPLETFTDDPDLAEFRETPAFRKVVADVQERNAIVTLLQSERAAEGVAKVRAARAGMVASEEWLVATGYQLLGQNFVPASIAIFTIATERFPRSANAWESRSEAEERAGRAREAIRHAQKALTLQPSTTVKQAAEERIRRLQK